MASMRPLLVIAILVAATLMGCDWSQKIAQLAPDTVSLADRCAEIMQKAMPFATIEIGERSSRYVDLRTISAQAAGRRTDQEGNPNVDRDLAVQCTFVDNVLTAFRWTKGAPAMH